MFPLLNVIRRATEVSCSILLVAILFILSVGIIYRYALNNALYWSDALSINLFTWMVFLGVSISVRNRSMFTFDLLLNRLDVKYRAHWKRVIHLIELLVLGVVAYYGIQLTQMQWGMILAAFPQWYPTVNFGWVYLSIPIGAMLMLVEIGLQVFDFQIKGKQSLPQTPFS